MGADDPKPQTLNLTPICSETRGLAEHLTEEALAANHLENVKSAFVLHQDLVDTGELDEDEND